MQLINSSSKTTKTKCSYHTNRKMSDETYKLKREVMSLIYEAKELLNNNMARVTIRITDCHKPNVLGTAGMGRHIIWIPAKTLNSKHLREVVYHELCHALWATPHIETCKLMSSSVNKRALSKSTVQKLFLKYAKGNS